MQSDSEHDVPRGWRPKPVVGTEMQQYVTQVLIQGEHSRCLLTRRSEPAPDVSEVWELRSDSSPLGRPVARSFAGEHAWERAQRAAGETCRLLDEYYRVENEAAERLVRALEETGEARD